MTVNSSTTQGETPGWMLSEMPFDVAQERNDGAPLQVRTQRKLLGRRWCHLVALEGSTGRAVAKTGKKKQKTNLWVGFSFLL